MIKKTDYSGFSIKKLNDPRFSHIRLLAGWIVYFVMYMITERFIPESDCHLIHCRLDDMIPFNEYFAVFYVLWYVLVFGSLLYTLMHDVEKFKQIQIYIMLTQAIAMLTYIFYPSIQDLRPDLTKLGRENLFTWVMSIIYAFDTPTGVFPSLHVAYSIAILSVFMKGEDVSKAVKAALLVFTLLVCAAVCFVKQHSALDVVSGIVECAICELLVFGRYWKRKLTKQTA